MKILITGTGGIARALASEFVGHEVVMVSRRTGHDINNIDSWAQEFISYDMFINCAYDQWGQITALEWFFSRWRDHSSKTIVSIGSRTIYYPRTEPITDHWPYRIHKLALQAAHDSMVSIAQCNMKIIHLGPVDTNMISHLDCKKLPVSVAAAHIRKISQDPLIKRVDLWL